MENVVYLRELCDKIMEEWHKVNREMPKRVIFYRDGISEEQYSSVLSCVQCWIM